MQKGTQMVAKTSAELNSPAPDDAMVGSLPLHVSWASRLIRKVRWRAHWLMPNTVPPPYGSDKSYYEQRDRESNEESRVPNDEELCLRVVWGMELFGPGEVEALCDRLRRLKWSAGGGQSKENDALNWVRHQRAYGGAGSSYNVGLVTESSDRKRFLLNDNHSAMPVGVDHLHVRIFQLTPSLTCILIGFALKEHLESTYSIEINRDRRTVRERSGRSSISIIEPDSLKRRSIDQARSKTRDVARRWFGANLPGYFCSLPNDRMPTAELITTNVYRLLSNKDDKKTGIHFDWRHLLSNAPHFEIWTSAECAGLEFAMDDRKWTKETSHLVVAMCISEISPDTLQARGGNERFAYIAYCHEHMAGIFSNYAGVALLKEKSKDLKTSRATKYWQPTPPKWCPSARRDSSVLRPFARHATSSGRTFGSLEASLLLQA